MADFLDVVGALGNGPIPRVAALLSQQNKQKQINDAVMETIRQGLMGQQPGQQPTTINQAFPEYKQQALSQGFGLDDYIAQATAQPTGNQTAQPTQTAQPLGLGTGLRQYPTSRDATLYQQQPIQPIRPIQTDNSAMLQQIQALAGKGMNPLNAMQLVSGINSTRKAQEKSAAATEKAPGLYMQLYQHMTADNRPAAAIIALRLKQMGLEVPVGYLQWANPDYKHIQSNLGDKTVISSFNPAKGKAGIAQVFDNGAKPMSQYEQYRIANGLVGSRGGGGGNGGGGGKSGDGKFDPASDAKNIGIYRKAVNGLIQNEDGSYKTKKQIEMDLNNANVQRQLALYAASAGIDLEQVENDMAYIRENLKNMN